MKIYFDYPLIKKPWGGGAHFLVFFSEFLKENGHKIIFKLKGDIDLIFLSNNTQELAKKIIHYKKRHPNTKILHRINECDKRKNTNHVNNLVFYKNSFADYTVFISKWLSEYYINLGFNKEYQIVYNACNQDHFFPEKNKELGDSINLVTHHWSNHWMKGFDIYTELDNILEANTDLTFTYIGRYYNGYHPKNTKIISPLYGKELGAILRNFDIYLTASRWEPCGMHHIEGASCGLPVLFHRDGGGINESCRDYGVAYNDITSLLEGINKIKNDYKEYRNKIRYDFLDSKRACQDYYNIINNILE